MQRIKGVYINQQLSKFTIYLHADFFTRNLGTTINVTVETYKKSVKRHAGLLHDIP